MNFILIGIAAFLLFRTNLKVDTQANQAGNAAAKDAAGQLDDSSDFTILPIDEQEPKNCQCIWSPCHCSKGVDTTVDDLTNQIVPII